MAITFFLSPLTSVSLRLEGRELMEAFQLGLSVSVALILYIMSGCGTLYFFHLLKENTSLVMVEQVTDLGI